MPDITIRIFAGRAEQILCARYAGKWADVPLVMTCIVTDYLEGMPYPGTMRATVTTSSTHAHYVIQIRNDGMDVYRRVGTFAFAGYGAPDIPEPWEDQRRHGYAVWLYAGHKTPVRRVRIKCRRADFQYWLARVAAEYLSGNPLPDAMWAFVKTGRRPTAYVLLPGHNTLEMYRHVQGSVRVEITE